MKYKIWAVTYITEKQVDGIITSIKERTKKVNHASKYLFETDSLEELREELIIKKDCNKVHFNYDS